MPARQDPVEHAPALLANAEIGTARTAQRARARLQQWRAESAQNEAACAEAERRWAVLGQLATLRGSFDKPPAAPAPRPGAVQRRTLLGLAAVATGMGLLAWRSYPREERVQLARDLRTGTAQLLRTTLPDGSEIHLSAQTALHVALSASQRAITLREGEARFSVAADATRPFTVTTPLGRVEVTGTVFSVAQRGALMRVSVEQGRVLVRPGPATALGAGEALEVRQGVAGPVRRIDVAEAAAWRSGWLVFDNTRLDEAVPEINAFLARPLVLDPSAAALRLTGRFRANDPQNLVRALPVVLPLKLRPLDDGATAVSAR